MPGRRFESLLTPGAEKYPVEANTQTGKVMASLYKHFAVELEQVQENVAYLGLLDEQSTFLKGWFKDTVASAPISQLAIMRLDVDYYESTHDSLVRLCPKLSSGGYVIIDDYGEDTWRYCRRGVDDCREREAVAQPLVRVDSQCFY